MSSVFPERRAAVALVLAAWLVGTLAVVAPAGAEEARILRVCADPNNLPFSNDRGEGLENRLAELLARELGATVRYTWWAQRRGFLRHTLRAGACDAIMGVPADLDAVRTTRPYYRSTYVFVTRADRALDIRSFDDPALRRLRIGVQLIGNDYANTPPVHALSRRGVVGNLVGYTVYGDYATANPPARPLEAVARGDVDVAVVWGPLAGYFAPRQAVGLRVTPVAPAEDPPAVRQVFAIAVGVRRDDAGLRDELDAALARRRSEVEALVAAYGVPLAAASR
jgi:mxaJ protein